MDYCAVDLHCHSTASDGVLTPLAVAALAAERGVEVLALTDHDTVQGLAAVRQWLAGFERPPFQLISGVEVSAQWGKRGVHIVGLGFDEKDPALLQFLESQLQRRRLRAEQMLERLAKRGFTGLDDLLLQPGIVGRLHIARRLVELGAVETVDLAFKRYLGDGKPAYVSTQWPTMAQAIDVITAAGGQAVLAHPLKYKMTLTKLRALLADFAVAGGAACEVVSGKQVPSDSRRLWRDCERLGLLASRGSDFHRPGLAWQALGMSSALPAGCKPVWPLLLPEEGSTLPAPGQPDR